MEITISYIIGILIILAVYYTFDFLFKFIRGKLKYNFRIVSQHEIYWLEKRRFLTWEIWPATKIKFKSYSEALGALEELKHRKEKPKVLWTEKI